MSESIQNAAMTELKALRVWRAFLVEVRGRCYGLDQLSLLVRMTLDDGLSAVGLGDSAWAQERWAELSDALDEPVVSVAGDDAPLPNAA